MTNGTPLLNAIAHRVFRARARRLLGPARPACPRIPVVLVPGIMGSTLRKDSGGRRLWGDLASFYAPPDGGRDLMRPPADATDTGIHADEVMAGIALIPGLIEVPVYRDLVDYLTAELGYTLDTAGRPGTLFLHAYNWRLDLMSCARNLRAHLGEIGRRTGSDEVIVVGHSHGGVIASLVTRLEDGAGSLVRVRAVVALAAAFAGAVDNLRLIVEGYRPAPGGFLFGAEVCMGTLSALETLPRPGTSCVADRTGEPADIDLYSAAAWQRLGLGPFAREIGDGHQDLAARLSRAAALHAHIAAPPRQPPVPHPSTLPPPHILIAGTGIPTLVRAVLDEEGGREGLSFPTFAKATARWGRSVADRLFTTGDGEVPADSLAPWGGPGQFDIRYVNASHRGIINAPAAAAAVGRALLEVT